MSQSRRRVSSYEVVNLADDKTFAKRKKKVNRIEAQPAAAAPGTVDVAPVLPVEPLVVRAERPAPVPPTMNVQANKPAIQPQKKRRSKKNTLANELGRLYGLPADLFLEQDEDEAARLQQNILRRAKRDREAVAEEEANAARDNAAVAAAAPVVAAPAVAVANSDEQQNKKQDIKPLPSLSKIEEGFLKELYDIGDFDTLQNLPLDFDILDPEAEPASPVKPAVAAVTLASTELPPVKSFDDMLREEINATTLLLNKDVEDDISCEAEQMEFGEEEDELAFERIPPIFEMRSNGSIADVLDQEFPIAEITTSKHAIHDAVKSKDINEVKAALELKPTSVLYTDENNQTAYQLAVILGLTEIAELLKHADEYVILDIMTSVDLRKNAEEVPPKTATNKSGASSNAKLTSNPNTMYGTKPTTRASHKAAQATDAEQDAIIEELNEKLDNLQEVTTKAINNLKKKVEQARRNPPRSATRSRQ